MTVSETQLRDIAEQYGQQHLFQFWSVLNEEERRRLLEAVSQIDFALMDTLIKTWVLNEPEPEHFSHIVPVDVIPPVGPDTDKEALHAGEQALRDGRVATFVVAGGQGTRLGFDKPKGAYPIGPMTNKTLFRYHAEKIHNLQRRYETTIPWYIMVSPTNDIQTRDYFREEEYFGLDPNHILFCRQKTVPCVDESGKFILDTPCQPAVSPNGHGGSIGALVEGGALDHAQQHGVDIISYFQVDNWAVKVADPWFIGYHCLANASMSSKCHRRNDLREAVGVHCLCDGVYRVIEYSELDLYPQLLAADADGAPVFFAGNPAIHILSAPFVKQLYEHFDDFPWHKAHKKIPYVNNNGERIKPEQPNGYKFETFVFDALRFIPHAPVALEINRPGEYTPIKQFEGINSVVAARESMASYWAKWLKAAGYTIPCDTKGTPVIPIEISPVYALTKEEFVEKSTGHNFDLATGIAIEDNT